MSGQSVTTDEALEILSNGELEVVGRMPWSSNATFLAKVAGDTEALAIYKPRRGERPLWDFPEGTLCQREVASFVISEALGWAIVPPTILRPGPAGEGMVQLFIDHDPDEHYLNLCSGHATRFGYFAAFDVIINNADRKSGHCLRAKSNDHIWGIDHGVSFHSSPKLRTVIWDYAGQELPPPLAADLERLDAQLGAELGDELAALLSEDEADATRRRLQRLLAMGHFPQPRSDYPFPWPMV